MTDKKMGLKKTQGRAALILGAAQRAILGTVSPRCVSVFLAQSCLTLRDPIDCSLPGSSVPGILQAGILEWVAISFSRRSSQPRDQNWVSHIAGRRFII